MSYYLCSCRAIVYAFVEPFAYIAYEIIAIIGMFIFIVELIAS